MIRLNKAQERALREWFGTHHLDGEWCGCSYHERVAQEARAKLYRTVCALLSKSPKKKARKKK